MITNALPPFTVHSVYY